METNIVLLNNYVNIDANAKRRRVGDDEVDSVLLVKVIGIMVRTDLIIVESDQATALVSSSTTTNTICHGTLKLYFCFLFSYFCE